MLDALETRFPALCGTLRDHNTNQCRAFVRFSACEEDISQDSPDTPRSDAVVNRNSRLWSSAQWPAG